MEKEIKISEIFKQFNREFGFLKNQAKVMKQIRDEFEMKKYRCILSTHCQAPEFEIEVEAKSRDEAVDKIVDGYDIKRSLVLENLEEL